MVGRLPGGTIPLQSRVKVIYSSVGWVFDELLQCFFAAHQEQGGRLVGLQHGGSPYGTGINPVSLLKKEIVDNFLAWGWKLSASDIPFLGMDLSFNKKKLDSRCQSKKREDILYVTTTISMTYHSVYVMVIVTLYSVWDTRNR